VAGEETAFRLLTLFVAVAEQALLELDALHAPHDNLSAAIKDARDLAYATLQPDGPLASEADRD
jgi:hypothetical protein